MGRTPIPACLTSAATHSRTREPTGAAATYMARSRSARPFMTRPVDQLDLAGDLSTSGVADSMPLPLPDRTVRSITTL